MSFPSSIDSFTGFTSGETLQAASHAAQSNQEQTAIVAVETKVGTGASTPTANNVLVGNGVGTSTWGQVGLSTGVSGILPVTSGGTGTGTSTGTGSVVLNSTPTTNNETATNLTSTKLNNSSGLTNTGGLTTDTQTITGNATVGGTLGVTGATSLSGGATVNSNPVWQYLGYAQITSDFNTTSTSYVDVTGLSVVVTIPTGVTKVRITAFVGHGSASVANAGLSLNIYDVTASAQLNQADAATDASADTVSMNPIAIHTPAAGSRTYKCQFRNNGNAATVHTNSSATIPSFILVECC